MNGAIANFKGWVNGKMKRVATKYLTNYLAWFKESNAKLDKQQMLKDLLLFKLQQLRLNLVAYLNVIGWLS